MKSRSYAFLAVVLICGMIVFLVFYLSSSKPQPPKFKSIQTNPEIMEWFVEENIKSPNLEFRNPIGDQQVSLMGQLKDTSFHFYNDVIFDGSVGAMAGGTRLRVQITKDGGENWQRIGFSRFSNAFHKAAVVPLGMLFVGEDKHIYRTKDFGESWQIFDTSMIDPEPAPSTDYPKYYDIAFWGDEVGFIAGQRHNAPAFLMTTDGGENWMAIDTTGLPKSGSLTELQLMSPSDIFAISPNGKLFHSTDAGTHWTTVHTVPPEYGLLALAFSDERTALLGGAQGYLAFTDDGGETWSTPTLPSDTFGVTVTNIKAFDGGFLILTSKFGYDSQRPEFVYFFDPATSKITPYFAGDIANVAIVGDAHGMSVVDGNIYIADRNNLYRLKVDR